MTEGDTTARPDKRRRQGAWSLAMARQFEAALGGESPVVLARAAGYCQAHSRSKQCGVVCQVPP